MAIKTFTTGELLTASDTNTYLTNSGLVFVKQQTILTTVGSVAVPDAFSATYDSYKIVITGGSASTANAPSVTLGATTTGYYSAGLFVQIGVGTVGGLQSSNAANWSNMGRANTNGINVTFDIFQPFATRRTVFVQTSGTSETAGFYISQSGFLDNATSYTEFTLTAGGGTFTGGIITVYGYRKA
jgi:hypothetical protein